MKVGQKILWTSVDKKPAQRWWVTHVLHTTSEPLTHFREQLFLLLVVSSQSELYTLTCIGHKDLQSAYHDCTDIMYCTHSEPSDRAAHMTSPVTRPSAPWSPTWDKIAHTYTHTQELRYWPWHQTRADYFLQSLIKMSTFTLQSAGWSAGGFLHLRGWTWLASGPWSNPGGTTTKPLVTQGSYTLVISLSGNDY